MKFAITVDSLYLEHARDQRICSKQREFDLEKEKQVTAYTKGLRLREKFEIEGVRDRESQLYCIVLDTNKGVMTSNDVREECLECHMTSNDVKGECYITMMTL